MFRFGKASWRKGCCDSCSMHIYEGNGPVASVPSQMRRCNTKQGSRNRRMNYTFPRLLKIRGSVAITLLIGVAATAFAAGYRSAGGKLVRGTHHRRHSPPHRKPNVMENRLVVTWKVFRTFLAGTIITLAIAASATFKADEGSAAALITMCSVAILFLALLSRLKKDFPTIATIMSFVLAILAAVFWLFDERPFDVSRAETLRGLLYALGLSAVVGLVAAGGHVVTLRKQGGQGTDGGSV